MPNPRHLVVLLGLLLFANPSPERAQATPSGDPSGRVDYLSFARGALPITIEGATTELSIGMEHALQAIDGNPRKYTAMLKPGGSETQIAFVYKLPALTTFTEFAVPDVLETPSPSQTFFGKVEIAGSATGADGSFQVLASAPLEAHAARDMVTSIPASLSTPVQFVRVTLSGGIDLRTEKTFFQFSEIVGFGEQEAVPRADGFNSRWKGRGVLLELKQDGARVSGCYDGVGDLEGTVSGNLLHATGKARDTGVPSTFVLTIGDDGAVVGVRSTNGAPFRLYTGAAAPEVTTECSERAVSTLGCGAIVHGIEFDFDSADIRPASAALLDSLADGLRSETAAQIIVVGHTSSEGAEAYNDDLSRRRAEAVVAAMIARDIDAERMAASGRGERTPIADNATEAGRSLNRRVEIECS